MLGYAVVDIKKHDVELHSVGYPVDEVAEKVRETTVLPDSQVLNLTGSSKEKELERKRRQFQPW